jgi:hypothetical protein
MRVQATSIDWHKISREIYKFGSFYDVKLGNFTDVKPGEFYMYSHIPAGKAQGWEESIIQSGVKRAFIVSGCGATEERTGASEERGKRHGMRYHQYSVLHDPHSRHAAMHIRQRKEYT